MKRFGQIGKLKPEKRDEYIRLHANVWPEVIAMLKQCHISDYSIYNHGLLCFASFEYKGENYERDMKRMTDDVVTQRWWTHTKPCFEQYTFSDKEAFYADMTEIFRMD